MELNDLCTVEQHEKGAEVQIINPLTGDLTDVYIQVQGVDSKAFRQAKLEAYRKALEVAGEGGQYDAEEVSVDILSKVTMGWRGLTNEGEELPFSEQKARELYLGAPAIREQVDRFVSARANFTKG